MATLTESSFASESGHWYRPDGSAAYTVIGANGKERATTLRDARTLGLLPSVSAILKIEAAPALTNWMIQQACLSCLTLPRLEGENEDGFIKRALIDSREQARKAAERGTYLHGQLELAVNRETQAMTREDAYIILPCLNWLHTNFNGYTWHTERSFASGLGYGGKVDLVGESATDSVVIDYKFKTDIVEGKRLAYDNHSTQLAAYAFGLMKPDARCINLFISSSVPGLIIPHEWPKTEIRTGWDIFNYLLNILETKARAVITESRLEKAMTYLAQTDEKAAELKSEVDRSEYKAKTVKATVFLHLEGTVAEREAGALTANETKDAYREHFQAIRDFQAIANKRELERLVVEVWRSENANRRVGNV